MGLLVPGCTVFRGVVRLSSSTATTTPAAATAATSSPYTLVNVKKVGKHVVQVELNRPAKRNALTHVMWGCVNLCASVNMCGYGISVLRSEIRSCFESLRDDSECRAIVVTGAGEAFCAGMCE